MSIPLKILVNAIPLTNIKTGIGRYIEGLYRAIEELQDIEVAYFDGRNISSKMPYLQNEQRYNTLVKIYWSLPAPIALLARLLMHWHREIRFKFLCRGFQVYHEPGFFPFSSTLPTVFTIHDLSLLLHPEWHPRERVWFFRLFFNRRLINTSHIITPSQFIKQEITTSLKLPDYKISVIYHGYDKGLFKLNQKTQIEMVVQKFGLPKTYYLFVGTGDPRKNLELLERALPNLRYPLVVTGWEGWKRPNNADMIFLRYVDDHELAHLYSGAKALILPSLYEGFGLPALEAMACGCPVILTKKASLPEVGGNAAIYIHDHTNVSELLNALALLEDPKEWKKRRRLCLEQAAKFSWDKAAKLTANIFREICQNYTTK